MDSPFPCISQGKAANGRIKRGIAGDNRFRVKLRP